MKLVRLRISLSMLLAALCFVSFAQKPVPTSSLEIALTEDEAITSFREGNARINQRTGHPIALSAVNQEVFGNSSISKAKDYLIKNRISLGLLKADLSDLKHHATRSTNAGDVVRFRQYVGDVPVNKAELTVSIDPNDRVQFVMNSYESQVKIEDLRPGITAAEAMERAMIYINPQRMIQKESAHLMIYVNQKITRLAYEVVVFAGDPLGEFHVLVDAKTGEIFKVKDELHYYCKHEKGHDHKPGEKCAESKKRSAVVPVNGNGFIFDPDPLSSNTVAYGGNYADNSDATNADLDAARFNVTLFDIDETAGMFKLEGPWAEIVDTDLPSTGLFIQNSSVFEFDRLEQGFEAVNCYSHIDYLMRYINDTLGCAIRPYQYTTGVRFDPHGADGADNSFYSSGTGSVTFGEGGVDDGEDSDVIHHELGHGLHDWVTAGGLSQVNGLSEGTGDYIAQSYNRGLGNWTPADAAYNWVFNWDGHNPFWNGRITNYGAAYPGGLIGQIHTDGQIWATSCMGIWDAIGQQRMDKIFYEGLGMTNGSSSQDDAANAVYQAAINLGYTTAELAAIHGGFTATGYILPPLGGQPPTAGFSADATSICLDNTNTVSFTDETVSSPAVSTWSWTFEGGTPATSTTANNVVTYAADGTYDVTLIVTNSNGADTLEMLNYIDVTSGTNCPSCLTGMNNTVVPISENGANIEYESVITLSTGGTITDVNVTNITGLHTWLGDLTFFLISPDSTVVQLNEDVCGTDENFDVGFDDAAATSTLACPYDDGTIYIPFEALSAFNGLDAAGDWTLVVLDDANQDGGELQEWSLEVCIDNSSPCISDLTLPTVTTGTYKAANSIMSDATVVAGDSVIMEAGMFVDLLEEFEVELSGVLYIDITPCTSFNKDESK